MALQLLTQRRPKAAAGDGAFVAAAIADDSPAPAPTTPEAVENRPLSQIEINADAPTANLDELPDFATLGVTVAGVVESLAAQKITRPNALQRAAFAEIAAGRDAILHAWTGSGKTLAFLLPLLERLDPNERSPQLLVLCPSRELAFQIARVAEAVLVGSSMSACAVVGGANPNRQLEKIKKERPAVIVGTPGRVCELAFDWQKLKLQRVRQIVIDEVDAALKPYADTCAARTPPRSTSPAWECFARRTSASACLQNREINLEPAPLTRQLCHASPIEHNGCAVPTSITASSSSMRHRTAARCSSC